MHPDPIDSEALDSCVLCWPAEHQAAFRGWSLRTGSSPSLRANSAFPYSHQPDLGPETLAGIEAYFRERGRRPAFRIAPFGVGPRLEAALEEAEYAAVEPTAVLTRTLDPPGLGEELDPRSGVRFLDESDWLRRLAAVAGQPPRIAEHYRIVQARAPRPRSHVAIEVEGETVAVVQGIRVEDWFGVFDLVVAEPWRGPLRGGPRRRDAQLPLRRARQRARARALHGAGLQGGLRVPLPRTCLSGRPGHQQARRSEPAESGAASRSTSLSLFAASYAATL
jgi:hypothetical protein